MLRPVSACAVAAGIVLQVLGAAPLCAQSPAAPSTRPNVVLILVDDLGWADTTPYGSTFHDTPAIDRLAHEGVRFTQFYAASPVCSPTRASLMSGRHPARVGITDWIGGADTGPLLPPPNGSRLALEEVTVGEAFQRAGYVTGYVGKWHLGVGAHLPAAQGFGFTKAVNNAGQPASYFFPYEAADAPATNVPGLAGAPGDYLTDRLTDESLKFIEANRHRPFFLVLSHYAVHTPLQAVQALKEKYEARAARLPAPAPEVRTEGPRSFTKLRQDHPVYAAMVESTDTSVGRIVDHLQALGLADGTIVVFVSDNGGLSTLVRPGGIPTSNAPLRAGKGWLYEGGVRVPFIVRWPAGIPGGRVVDVPGCTTDLYPTLLALAGLPAMAGQHLDGIDLAGVIAGRGTVSRDELFWHFPHYHGSGHTPGGAIRAGRFKLIEWFEDGQVELYDLAADPYEQRDLAEAQPDRVRALRDRLRAWRASVGAQMPVANPGWPARR